MERMTPFYDIATDPIGYARAWKARTRSKVVGYFCSYAPEEIIWAAGVLPYRILGGGQTPARADAHLQAYCCSLVRAALDDALAGRLGFLDGTVFPHTCDSIQRLSDIWRLNTGFDFHLDLVLPVKLNTRSAEQYMLAVLKKFRIELEGGLGVDITERELKKAIDIFNQIRSDLRRLYALRSRQPAPISSSDLHAIARASMVMDRGELCERLAEICEGLDAHQAEAGIKKIPLVLTGGICSMPDIYRHIEAAGGTVVGDDFCTGSRSAEGAIDVQDDPLKAIARRYYERINCPAKHRDCSSRGDHLLKIVDDTRARGVIFVLLKFCDPHAFDFPYLKEFLERAGIPSLLLEIEEHQISTEQLTTRLEAFIERL
ncbi:MAG: 2-hydroxyacyl-CoA dehydratase [Deltaproteobacteria bacterium]|jgi:bcr-type benzoyl-CoA reductase subunit C|nr:2-hydroxyacyl-CoA dehydratase [Deltaproteobacteria bacterium]MBW2517802.1 2-hydroxyacyl-CoA dehydratase [Deltaproteobacteria bacterium]